VTKKKDRRKSTFHAEHSDEPLTKGQFSVQRRSSAMEPRKSGSEGDEKKSKGDGGRTDA